MNRFMFDKDKPLRLVEFFSGIGFQRTALQLAGIPYEVVATSEIDKFAITAYEAIHGDNHNLGSITDVKGSMIPEDIDILTYSFPCTDLSKAGGRQGMSSGTRSGLVYEVLRVLDELKAINNLPKVLVMENVVDLIQAKFIDEFESNIKGHLSSLGYSNHIIRANARNYGIAQNRDRVFMVSILGDYDYVKPEPFELDVKIQDYLDDKVDDKYYLSDKQIKSYQASNFNQERTRLQEKDYCDTLLARDFKSPKLVKCVGANKGSTRKITPREYGKLMGMNDSQLDRQLSVVSDTQAYKQHGNGIVAQVMSYVIGSMWYDDYDELKRIVKNNTQL